MDLIDTLRTIATRIPKMKQEGLIKTEEGTKNALIMPFINALGYNVFDPLEVTPELVADVGVKKGEKVDYAILREGRPIILFECKSVGTNLNNVVASQLYRYFTVTSARFGVLTDGIIYRFYTDLVTPNIMDAEPFFVFDMLNIREQDIEELKKFTKSQYDEAGIITSASELKYKGLIKNYLSAQASQPTEAFIKLVLQETKAYTGRITQSVIDDFVSIMRDSIRAFVSDQVEARLKSALTRETEPKATEEAQSPTPPEVSANELPAIVTTDEEIEAFFVIKSILRGEVDSKRIHMRDNQTYCAILLDDNNRRTICRLRFGNGNKIIGILDDQKREKKVVLNDIDEIYQYTNELKAITAFYDHRELNN